MTAGEPDELDSILNSLSRYRADQKQAARIFDRVLNDIVATNHRSMSWGDRLLTLDKSAAFRDDETFRAALAHADSSTGMTQYKSPDGIAWRYNTLIWAARTCLPLPGDFVECGVYRGDMTWMVTRNVPIRQVAKTFYLYDTFSGFDPRYSSEADFAYAPETFAISNYEYKTPGNEDYVRERFRDDDYIVVTKGVVPDILHEVAPSAIAFLHLDMNSPRAEIGALEILFDRISANGIIVLDDYGWKIFQPQKAAADEFMRARGQVILEMPTGQGLMIKRTAIWM